MAMDGGLNFSATIIAFFKGRKSETSIYPAFEVILRKTFEQLQRFYLALKTSRQND
jgi:hypothetical protein